MHVYLTARHIELTPAIRAYVDSRIVAPVRDHNRLHVTRVEVQLYPEGEKGNYVGCHVLVSVKGHKDISVREIDHSLFEAIDVAKDRVVRQLTELRDRILTRSRHPRKYSFARLARALGWSRQPEQPEFGEG